jgi:hypothetical protein
LPDNSIPSAYQAHHSEDLLLAGLFLFDDIAFICSLQLAVGKYMTLLFTPAFGRSSLVFQQ